MVQKFNQDGDILWSQSYNSSGINSDFGVAVTTDADRNALVCGTTNSNGQFDVFVVKYNEDGAQQWAIQYNSSPYNLNDLGTAIKTDADGNVYLNKWG